MSGPLENGEASVLRCDQGNSIPLILDELGRREVSSTAELFRMDQGSRSTIDWFCHRHLLDLRPTSTTRNLGAKTEQFMLIGEYYSAVNRSQSRDCVDGPAECLLPGSPSRIIGDLAAKTG
jgi:hypothetical protein